MFTITGCRCDAPERPTKVKTKQNKNHSRLSPSFFRFIGVLFTLILIGFDGVRLDPMSLHYERNSVARSTLT